MTIGDFLHSLLIGFLGSILASIVVLFVTNRRNKKKIRLKYSGPVGNYDGYGYIDDQHNIQIDKPQSEALIQYDSENRLLLKCKELNNLAQWSGIVAMETENYGTVSWRYDSRNNKSLNLNTHEFGFKRLIYLTRENKKIVYLVGEEGYGKEILIQKDNT